MLLQLYLHFPFCKQKCLYCDFCSAAQSEQTIAAYCVALKNNLFTSARKYAQAQIQTIFLGGGTPSLVPAKHMAGVLDVLKENFAFAPDVEFTSEANPGTLTREWLDMAVKRGLNRLSLGVQAAQDPLLRRIGRIHTFREAQEAVRLAREAGVGNINLDAMFGLPGQTKQEYLNTLDAFADLGVEHISAYSLILEEGTPLHAQVQMGKMALPDEDETAEMYEAGIARLQQLGYDRYEVSNFARPGYACRHNIGYWQGEWYLGMGVAAHSMLPPDADQARKGAVRVRIANGEDVHAFIKEGKAAEEIELIGKEEAMFETMMLALRTTRGVSEERFINQYGVTLRSRYGAQLDRLCSEGLGCWQNGWFALSPRGIEVQNEVLMRLME